MTALSEYMTQQINNQMNREYYNQRVYLSISAYFKVRFLDNIAKFFANQANGEFGHAEKFQNYVIDRFGIPEFQSLDGIPPFPSSATEAFQAAFLLEEGTTREIWNLYREAENEGDFATCEFMHWYIAEQVEEESTINNWLIQVQDNDCPQGLLEINELME